MIYFVLYTLLSFAIATESEYDDEIASVVQMVSSIPDGNNKKLTKVIASGYIKLGKILQENRSHYKKMMRLFHPDKHHDKPEIQQIAFLEITKKLTVLKKSLDSLEQDEADIQQAQTATQTLHVNLKYMFDDLPSEHVWVSFPPNECSTMNDVKLKIVKHIRDLQAQGLVRKYATHGMGLDFSMFYFDSKKLFSWEKVSVLKMQNTVASTISHIVYVMFTGIHDGTSEVREYDLEFRNDHKEEYECMKYWAKKRQEDAQSSKKRQEHYKEDAQSSK